MSGLLAVALYLALEKRSFRACSPREWGAETCRVECATFLHHFEVNDVKMLAIIESIGQGTASAVGT